MSDRFEIGEVAVLINCAYPVYDGMECEIVTEEYIYDGESGYDVIIPDAPCRKGDSLRGEWFAGVYQLRKKRPPSKDIEESRNAELPSFDELMSNFKKEAEKL